MLTFTNLFLTAYSDTVVAFFGAYLSKSTTDDLHDSKWLDPRMFACHEFNYSAKKPERLKEAFHLL